MLGAIEIFQLRNIHFTPVYLDAKSTTNYIMNHKQAMWFKYAKKGGRIYDINNNPWP
ncbi:MAG: hypothetical protein ACD_75C02579G0005 [uncultured bacterium]|nr:MAG: hypothetical protein ACD_75C02579G0005 [uncultured bacterium]